MAQRGAVVTGIDLSDKALAVARLHRLESGQNVDYRKISAEELAEQAAVVSTWSLAWKCSNTSPTGQYNFCLRRTGQPGGHVFFSTINRNAKAYLLAVVGAEYVLMMLPRAHTSTRSSSSPPNFHAGQKVSGWNPMNDRNELQPFNQRYSLGRNTDVNYLLHCINAV